MTLQAEIDAWCINTMRFLAVDAVQKARSGHPGAPMGAAPMAYVLWDRFLRHNPSNPQWPDRDRFVLSAGHASMLLYALLHLTGYDLSIDELQKFRQWGSKTPGHPEFGLTPGVEVTTGPLGQGFSHAVGMAMAERWLGQRYNRPGLDIVNHSTFALVSDGDLQEGVASEAASLAGTLGLGKLIALYDDNDIQILKGVPETLRKLKQDGYLLAVVTDTAMPLHTKLAWFEQGGFGDVWDAVISSQEIGVQKPDPLIFNTALRQVGVTADQAAFIGHSLEELQGARALGMHTIAFNCEDSIPADYYLKGFEDLLTVPLLSLIEKEIVGVVK